MKKKETNSADEAKQNELALRKAIRASENKNIRLNECMIVVRNIQNDFERQCRRIDRVARDGGGSAARQKQIRADMLMRQQILRAQSENPHNRTKWQPASKSPHLEHLHDDPEPVNNPSMTPGGVSRALLCKPRADKNVQERIPRFMDTIRASRGSDVPQDERALLLAMGASGANDEDGEQIAVSTFNPPHWTSMLAKEWLIEGKHEISRAVIANRRRPLTARSEGMKPSLSRTGAGLAPRDFHRGSKTARPSTAHKSNLLASQDSITGRDALRPHTAPKQTVAPLSLEEAELSAVKALRDLHHSVHDVFEDTPIAFHTVGRTEEIEQDFSSEKPPETHENTGTSGRLTPGSPNSQGTAPCALNLGGMQLPANSVLLPTAVLTRQLYQGDIDASDTQAQPESSMHLPLNCWSPGRNGKHHAFLNNINLRPQSKSRDPDISDQRSGGPDSVRSYLQTGGMKGTRHRPKSAWHPSASLPAARQGFSPAIPRAGTQERRLRLDLSLPRTSTFSGPHSQPNTSRITGGSRTARSGSQGHDVLIEDCKRVLDREARAHGNPCPFISRLWGEGGTNIGAQILVTCFC